MGARSKIRFAEGQRGIGPCELGRIERVESLGAELQIDPERCDHGSKLVAPAPSIFDIFSTLCYTLPMSLSVSRRRCCSSH